MSNKKAKVLSNEAIELKLVLTTTAKVFNYYYYFIYTI
jgi:hypothetical protein